MPYQNLIMKILRKINKEFIFLIAFIFYHSFVSISIGQDFVVKKEKINIKDTIGKVDFAVRSSVSCNTSLRVLVCVPEYIDNTPLKLTINVNGSGVSHEIIFEDYGWKILTLEKNSIHLYEGDNNISFVSNKQDIPMITDLKICDDANKNAYNIENIFNPYSEDISMFGTPNLGINERNEDYSRNKGCFPKQAYHYTFCKEFNVKEEQTVHIYAPSKDDPRFGHSASTIDFNVYMFHEDPNIFSQSRQSHNKSMLWDIKVDKPGIYYLLVEARDNNSIGGVSLLINNSFFRYNWVSKNEYCLSFFRNTNTLTYNIFTTNLKPHDKNSAPDPRIWLKKRVSEESEIIIAHNDDNNIISDFDWGKNARIQMPLKPEEATYYALLASSNPLMEPDTCDFYHSYWNLVDKNTIKRFPNLKPEDAIESDFGVPYYNCIAWCAGVDNTWVWPKDSISNKTSWYDSLFNNEPVHSLSGLFQRHDNLLKYTREGATEANSVVDLWGIITSHGDTIIMHASIRNPFSKNPPGYDWESKLGDNSRLFHPRNALSGIEYGQIIAHYRIADKEQHENLRQRQLSNEEDPRLSEIVLTEDDILLLNKSILSIPLNEQTLLLDLYENWKTEIKRIPKTADPWNQKKTIGYKDLMNRLTANTSSVLLLFDFFLKGDYFAMIPIQDFALNSCNEIKESWNNIMFNMDPDVLYRSSKSKINLFITKILYQHLPLLKNSAVYNEKNVLNITATGNNIQFQIQAYEPSFYSLKIINMDSNTTRILISSQKIEAGSLTMEYSIESGRYLAIYTLNDSFYSKKFIIP